MGRLTVASQGVSLIFVFIRNWEGKQNPLRLEPKKISSETGAPFLHWEMLAMVSRQMRALNNPASTWIVMLIIKNDKQ
jgi:hypothetical protein